MSTKKPPAKQPARPLTEPVRKFAEMLSGLGRKPKPPTKKGK